MKALPIALLAASLAGCSTMSATVQAPAPAAKHHKVAKASPVPVIMPDPTPQLAPQPQTFKQRFRSTFGKIRWLHQK